MKILYVEDQLRENIPKIELLFKKYINPKDLKQLQELNKQKRKPKELIKELVEGSGRIDVAYSFPMALEMLRNFKIYDLFVIDRNLSEVEYEFEDLKKLDNRFKAEFYDRYFEREGDYILNRLIPENVDVDSKLFFLTANSKDELKRTEYIDNHFDFGGFSKDNIIDKTDDKEIERLKYIIENNESLRLKKKFAHVLGILKTLDERLADNFIDLLVHKDDTDQNSIRKNLTTIRNFVSDNILPDVAKRFIADESYYKKENKDMIITRKVIGWLHNHKDHIYQIDSNVIIITFLYNIQSIASDFGDHKNYTKEITYPATSYTVNALLYGLMDIILWYGKLE
ncbi:MAG: hypothetical protein JXR56_03070 [Candidatus Cloacimonetes bacterium]|nr:hypothetical protein [Candidatus Cloacimonadota bacterium]